MKTLCESERCAGCMACADVCPHGAVTVRVEQTQCVPEIDPEKCTDCGLCRRVCQNRSQVPLREPMQWLQGWALDPAVRAKGSSGGVAGAITRAFLEKGGAVCSCTFADGRFCFRLAHTPAEADAFTGSKYVKSDPGGAYRQMKALLKKGQKVLFIGLPCQAAAAKLYMGEQEPNFYTADLICHGSPSPKVLEAFLDQYGVEALKDPRFRDGRQYRFSGEGFSPAPKGVRDRYTLAFLNGLSYTENCYACPYARQERVSDLTLGDSWGSTLSTEEAERGISLVLCQTEKGMELLQSAALYLTEADSALAAQNNHQLRHPTERPEGRDAFFENLQEGEGFNALVAQNFPRQCRRQDIKAVLARLGFTKK